MTTQGTERRWRKSSGGSGSGLLLLLATSSYSTVGAFSPRGSAVRSGRIEGFGGGGGGGGGGVRSWQPLRPSLSSLSWLPSRPSRGMLATLRRRGGAALAGSAGLISAPSDIAPCSSVGMPRVHRYERDDGEEWVGGWVGGCVSVLSLLSHSSTPTRGVFLLATALSESAASR
jgi:hypothetical protein